MKPLHAWDLSPEAAAQVQKELRQRLNLTWDENRVITTVGGVDFGIIGESARCAIVVFRFPELTPLDSATAQVPLVFPYIPGLLSFREGPAVLTAWDRLAHRADLLLFHGQGIAHPRGMGIASQMGLWLARPTIGVAKSRLFGKHEEVGPLPGDRVPLVGPDGTVIGAVLRTRERTNPLYISPGDRIDVDHAVEFVLACCKGYRLPEPTRWAHKVAGGEPFPAADNDLPRLL